MSVSLPHRDETPPATPGTNGHSAPPPRGRRTRTRAPLAVLLATSALLGGGVSAGVLLATGAVGDAGPTTTVVQTAGGATQGAAAGLNADALYASTSAGVVDITAKGVSSGGQTASPFGGPPQSDTTATGTGFVIDGSGNIVTASHVVDGASSVTVTFEDGTTRPATVVSHDDATDVALLKIDASGMTLHPLKLGSSSSLGVGDAVAAIGDPFGYQRSISTGIVSGLDRTVDAPNGFTVAHAIQTDAALNPGNSGGPLLDPSGKVVGIVDQIATNGGSDQSSGVGFAVPIDLVKAELSKLKSGATVAHAYLGVATSGTSTSTPGATLAQVTGGGPAADAGLRVGDVVTRIGGAKIQNANDLVAAIAGHNPGDKVAITVSRGTKTVQLTATLGTQPAQSSSGG
jgi:putative serine protease PepD